ncbi:MAG: helix-turn-helix domain-containing protein [Blautia coccoides]
MTRKRLERSRELLKDPALKIYEISDALGWADVSNYIKVFKKKYGISPNEYRRIAENTGGYYPKGEDI